MIKMNIFPIKFPSPFLLFCIPPTLLPLLRMQFISYHHHNLQLLEFINNFVFVSNVDSNFLHQKEKLISSVLNSHFGVSSYAQLPSLSDRKEFSRITRKRIVKSIYIVKLCTGNQKKNPVQVGFIFGQLSTSQNYLREKLQLRKCLHKIG